MHRILVPVDFSDTSLNALTYTIKLFRGSPLEITILHTFKVMSSGAFSLKSVDRIMEDDAHREMDALERRILKEAPDISLKSKILKADAIPAITSLGDSGAYDFVVMGTKGASGLKEVFIGSVAGGVISKTKAPVLVVPKGYQYEPLSEITFAVSSAIFFDKSVVEPLRKLSKKHSGKVNILHVADGKKLEVQKVLGIFEDLNPSVSYSYGSGNVNEQLNEYLRKENTGLLCLVRGKRGFFSKIFGESVTLKQTFNSSVPLLILHD